MTDVAMDGVLPCSIPPGLQLLKIASMKRAVSDNGQPIMRGNAFVIDIDFINDEGQTGKLRVPANEKNQYVFDNLCNAIRVDNVNRTPSVKEVVGKKVYVVCRGYINIEDGVNTETIVRTELVPKFYLYSAGMPKPKTIGDPSLPGVTIGGDYLSLNIYETKETDGERDFGDA